MDVGVGMIVVMKPSSFPQPPNKKNKKNKNSHSLLVGAGN
jgi:hypothetical protein